jgi:hypothetical protein
LTILPKHIAALFATALALVTCAPPPALADDDVRVTGTCGAGATSTLRLKPHDGEIELRFEVDHRRVSGTWRIVIVQERRVVWRGQTRARSGRARVRRQLSDLIGVDRIRVHASGPRGIRCTAAGTLAG